MEIDKLPNVKKYWINDGYLNIELKDNYRLRMNFNNIEILKEQLTLTDVSQQRELLVAFMKWQQNQWLSVNAENVDNTVDTYLSN